MLASAAIAAKGPSPDGIEMLGERFDERGIVGQDAVLEVALAHGLRTHPRAGEKEIRLRRAKEDRKAKSKTDRIRAVV